MGTKENPGVPIPRKLMAVMKDTGSGPTGLDGAPASITHQLDELYFFDYKMRITTAPISHSC